VLERPKLRRYEVDPETLEVLLRFLAPELPQVEVDVATRDPDDAPVVAAALAGGAEAIVTGDRGLLDHDELHRWLSDRGVAVLSPRDFLARLDKGS
jgi:predicted nucleic acid-binding protein